MESFSHSKPSHFLVLSTILVLLYLNIIVTVSAHTDNTTTTESFIKSSCAVTLYPKVCIESLSPYSDYIQTSSLALVNAALNATLKGSQETLNIISELSKGKNLGHREAEAISDCVENLKDSVYELQDGMIQMKDIDGNDFQEKMLNVLTWVSAALTDEDTCMDGFEGDEMDVKIKSSIGINIFKVAQLTSNALALIKSISTST
ncbi:hypothetical protein LIER_41727 [Lithospermum erythrorhizon]|uniref:pectinesterase n=1 Tax=Lithospermum erythrorhizon TaxID=34254 RepID=A0AAV3RHN4_LITER